MNLQVEYLPIDRLIPYAGNAKTHPPEQISKIAASIREYGFNAPVLLDGERGVIAGHGRIAAARVLGLPEVPCIRLGHLSDIQKRAYILADNRTAESPWDIDLLRLELQALEAEEFDLSLTGFDPGELSDFLGEPELPGEGEEEPYAGGDGEPVSVVGDIWQCGPHRIGCGDAADMDFIDRLLGGAKPDLVYCDPPYGIGEAAGRNKSRSKIAKAKDYGDEQWDNQIPLSAIQTALSLSSNVVLWGGNYFSDRLPSSSCWLVWDKENGGNDFADVELAWTSYAKAARLFRFRWAGMLQGDMSNKETRVHPTQKPVALHRWAFDKLGAGGIVADLFCGSGSTLIACERTGRACLTCDLLPKYVDLAVRRWQDETGTHAIHAETGEVFQG